VPDIVLAPDLSVARGEKLDAIPLRKFGDVLN
jgi:hypothetical protein